MDIKDEQQQDYIEQQDITTYGKPKHGTNKESFIKSFLLSFLLLFTIVCTQLVECYYLTSTGVDSVTGFQS